MVATQKTEEAFEETKSKRKQATQQQWDSSDDSDEDFRVPNMLVYKCMDNSSVIRNAFGFLPNHLKEHLPEKSLKTNAVKEQIEFLKDLLSGSGNNGGWSMFNPPQIILDQIQRDEFKLEESSVWPNFNRGD